MSNVVYLSPIFEMQAERIAAGRKLTQLEAISEIATGLYGFAQYAIAYRFDAEPMTEQEVIATPARRRLALNIDAEIARLSRIHAAAREDAVRRLVG